MKWARHLSCIEGDSNTYKVLVFKPEGRRPLGKWRYSWEDNKNLKETAWETVDWSHLWRALVNTAMSIRVP
jgi:hypothetical protein